MPFSEIELYDNRKYFLLVPRIKSRVTQDSNNSSPAARLLPPQSDMDNIVQINRKTGQIQRLSLSQTSQGNTVSREHLNALFQDMKSMTLILGVLGIVTLLSGRFLIVISRRDYIGTIKKHKVYQVGQIQFLPYDSSAFNKLPDDEREREYTYIEMINKIFVTDRAHYFSYSCDLTQSFQRQNDILTGRFHQQESTSSNPRVTVNQLWRYANERFFWNHHLSKPLRDSKLDGYVVPIIRGYVELIVSYINRKSIKFGLISRIGCKRSGTRYNTRGADLEGNVANFVETEQFLLHDGVFASYVQIRGSVPLIWTQYANLKYNPEIKFHRDKNKQRQAFKSHFLSLFETYGENITSVNLCKKKGQELVLSQTYESLIKLIRLPHKIDYIAFDFHAETKGLRMDRVSLLIDAVRKQIQNYKFHMELYKQPKTKTIANVAEKLIAADRSNKDTTDIVPPVPEHLELPTSYEDPEPAEPQPEKEANDLLDFEGGDDKGDVEDPLSKGISSNDHKFDSPSTPTAHQSSPTESDLLKSEGGDTTLQEQHGLFRVNCVDCCDRTNIVETAFARIVLEQQLKLLGIFGPNESIIQHEKFNKIFQHFWANNGDRISSLYAGTSALMSDYTRSGQRTVVGLMKDGVNAVTRYVQNNFKDSAKQRSLNLVLGRLDIHSDEEKRNNVYNRDILSALVT